MVITAEDLALANTMVTDLEKDMPKVFNRIGRTVESVQAERILNYVKNRGVVPYEEVYRYALTAFPDSRDLQGIMEGMLRSGLVQLTSSGSTAVLTYKEPKSPG
jgi:hypothetical protein